MPRHHDMGGRNDGPIDRTEHVLSPFEKRVDAMFVLLSDPTRTLITADELRRGIEDLDPRDYDGLPYYEKWLRGIVTILIEKRVLERAEIDRRTAALIKLPA